MKSNTVVETDNRSVTQTQSKTKVILKKLKRSRQLYILLIPCILFYIIFRYGPMYGLIISFKKFNIHRGIMGSSWVGLKYFNQFFTSADFWVLFKNTLLLGLYTLLWTFPFPIMFAILLNELKNRRFKKTVQTISFLPSFLSIVIIASMTIDLLSPTNGMVNILLSAFGFEKIYFMIKPEWFRTVYISTEIWQHTGFSAIIYLAALAGIDQSLYEAGKIDGCNRFQAMRHITLPGIFPTMATMFILRSGKIIKIGFEKVLLLYNPATYEVADVFSTYVYRKGLLETNFSYAAAVGLFESIIALILVVLSNTISKKLSDQSLY